MIFFNWTIIKRATKLDLRKIESVFDVLSGSKISTGDPKLDSAIIYSQSRGSHSFIKDATSLFKDKVSTNQEKLVYLDLISKRVYLDYFTRGILSLPVELAYEYDVKTLEHNRLLTIARNHIHFKYE